MKTVLWLVSVCTLCCVAAEAQVISLSDHPHTVRAPARLPLIPRSPARAGLSGSMVAKPLASGAPLPANVTLVSCPEGNSVCGLVRVPLDRRQPKGTQISIYFERYFHSNAGPAESAIMVNQGGPGFGTTGNRDYFQFLFGPNLDAHDLLLVDDRGRGMSGAIDCPDLQHGIGDFVTEERECAAQLGAAASRYGTGDIAKDMNDVRAALGIEFIDYVGASWGGADATAFATRFGRHLRSLVLDAPIGPPVIAQYTHLQRLRTHSEPRRLRLICARSPLCAPDHPDADEELTDLIQAVHAHSVEGDSHDASGNPLHVKLDEAALLNFVVRAQGFDFENAGEVLAAGAALRRGDPVPLLRLGAESFYTLTGDSGDPTGLSAGAYYATGCSDSGEPWDWGDPVAQRIDEDNEFLAALPHHYFAPFDHAIGSDLIFSALGKQCLWWQEPTPSSPIAPREEDDYPEAPTLIMVSDIDDIVPIEAGRELAELFPNSTLVTVVGTSHETENGSPCAQNIITSFIETLSPGDTSCANTPYIVWPAVGRFPRVAREASPADIDPTGNNQVGVGERKVVSVAVATAMDAVKRSGDGNPGFAFVSGGGVGLRGGTFYTTVVGNNWATMLTNCKFSDDVIVNGTIVWAPDNSILADLVVSGPGTAGGNLHVTGFFQIPGPVGNLKVSGSLGGKSVALLVPEA
jgi:pimeloyl-ACP methyl ester carboxylesterase